MDEAEALQRFSRSRIAMVLTDPKQDDNPIVYVNDAFERITGYARSAVLGRNCRFLQGDETDPESIARMREAISNCQDVTVDVVNYRADGTAFVNRLLISPIHDGDDDCAMFVGLQMPVPDEDDGAGDGPTPQAETDRQLREIQHRVKNHLSMIVGLIRMQSRERSGPEGFTALARRVESLQLLYEEVSLADRATGDPAGRGDRIDRIDLGSYLSRVASAIAHIDGRPGIRVSIEIDDISAALYSATQLGLILSEVLTNAFQHAFDGRDRGTIAIRGAARGDGLTLTVRDDGGGIPEGETWPRPNSLGGRIVDGLVRSLGGEVTVGDAGPGTIVTVAVPRLTRD